MILRTHGRLINNATQKNIKEKGKAWKAGHNYIYEEYRNFCKLKSVI